MSASSAATRLALLEGYLEEDADNQPLRLAAFEAACEAGQTQRALDLVSAQLATASAGAGAGAGGGAGDPALRASLQVLWLRTLHGLRRFDEAIAWARAEEAAGHLEAAAAGVASLLAWDAGEIEAAQRWARRAVDADPQHLEARLIEASVALMRGRNQQAEAALQSLLADRPVEGRPWFVAGAASLQRSDVPQARQRFAQAVERMADHIGSWHGLGWACLLDGDLAASSRSFEQALALDDAFAESHGAVGLVRLLRGDSVGAQPLLRTALKLDPGCVTARYARAVEAGEAGEGLQALADRLLDRPGFFGGTLAADMPAATMPDQKLRAPGS